MGRASVIDGDTLEIHGQRIRLHGIDAPESAQVCRRADQTKWRCGQQAALALQNHIGSQPVTCAKRDTDRYGRVVARCSVGGADINAWLVSEGWAVAYRRFSDDYVGQEDAARIAGKGIWSGAFIAPADWRRGERLGDTKPQAPTGAKPTAPTDCRIKGNISSRGERIYHVPGGQYYSRTRIDTAKGERWFCTEAEARAAGWRRSKR
jgi:endonuclease YncB( thermonuclease family)